MSFTAGGFRPWCLAKPNQSNAITEYFRKDEVPTEEEGSSSVAAGNAGQAAGVEENLF